MAVIMREIDLSQIKIPAPLAVMGVMVGPRGPTTPLMLIGKWNRRKYQYLSHRRKREYMKAWRGGRIQQDEFMKVFGEPCKNPIGLANPETFPEGYRADLQAAADAICKQEDELWMQTVRAQL